ncbi:MAG TPA: serine hydrolase domain-containing protein [Candidatus Limnocylindria bacterium]
MRTNRARSQARAIPVRGDRRPRTRPRLRAPVASVLLSTLAFLSPTLALAPLNASEPRPAIAAEAGSESGGRPTRGVRVVPLLDMVLELVAPPPRAVAEVASEALRYQSALDAARSAAGAYGVTFAAVRDGELLWAGSSGRARDGRTPLTPRTPLVIGSVTKTFVAAAVLQLVEEGRLRLDDPVRRHLPELGSLSREISIAQLLDHTSGLADLFNDETRIGLEEHPEHAWTSDEVLATLHAPWYQPGEGWAYANTNYYLLGLVIERMTGSTLTEELTRRFLAPLGLDSTGILDGRTPGGPLEPAWTSIFWGSGAMSASAADLARWGDALYAGAVLEPSSRALMLELNDHDYGYGVQKVEVDGAPGYGHTGLLNTYTTLLYHLPTEGVTVALLVNRSHVDLGGMLTAEPGSGPSLLELALGD